MINYLQARFGCLGPGSSSSSSTVAVRHHDLAPHDPVVAAVPAAASVAAAADEDGRVGIHPERGQIPLAPRGPARVVVHVRGEPRGLELVGAEGQVVVALGQGEPGHVAGRRLVVVVAAVVVVRVRRCRQAGFAEAEPGRGDELGRRRGGPRSGGGESSIDENRWITAARVLFLGSLIHRRGAEVLSYFCWFGSWYVTINKSRTD